MTTSKTECSENWSNSLIEKTVLPPAVYPPCLGVVGAQHLGRLGEQQRDAGSAMAELHQLVAVLAVAPQRRGEVAALELRLRQRVHRRPHQRLQLAVPQVASARQQPVEDACK